MLRILQADNAIRTIKDAVTATDTVVVYQNLTCGGSTNCICRAIGHAMRMFAMTVRRWNSNHTHGRARTQIESRCSAVGTSTGALAIVTPDTERFVDQERIRRFAKALAHDLIDGYFRASSRHVLRYLIKNFTLVASPKIRLRLDKPSKCRRRNKNCPAFNGGPNIGGTLSPTHQSGFP